MPQFRDLNSFRGLFFCLVQVFLWQVHLQGQTVQGPDADKVNLALRKTADALLRLSGDSTSRIPVIEQPRQGIWRVRLNQAFRYEQLPFLLQESLDQYQISQSYEVSIRRCEDAAIELGYHQWDLTKKAPIPCTGRDLPESCRYIEIHFLNSEATSTNWMLMASGVLFALISIFGLWQLFLRRTKPTSVQASDSSTEWLDFGNSKLNVQGQLLLCGERMQSLTFRETKLLHLFVSNLGSLLERDYILQQVWADEGVLIGRSMDVFVSRLRKKLAEDPILRIVAIHGVGYRMETGKQEKDLSTEI